MNFGPITAKVILLMDSFERMNIGESLIILIGIIHS